MNARPGPSALVAALELARMPSLADAMRRQPLPRDVLPLIRVAAGCRRTCQALAEETGREPRQIKDAALFYLEQILFRAEGDPCRTLGLAPDASREERREHMRWLMKWLHPDCNRHQWESVFAARVTAAWTALERGEVPAAEAGGVRATECGAGGAPFRLRWIADPVAAAARPSIPQLTMLVVAWTIVLALLLVPAFRDFWLPFGPTATAGVGGEAVP